MAAFRFALQASRAASPAAWRELARKTEDLGYATLYVPDHLDDQWAPMIALAVAAEATTSLRVGTLVLDNDFRHPVVLAKEAATLDVVTGGRFELGLGAGWMTTDYEQSGHPDGGTRRSGWRASPSASRSSARCGSTGSATFEGDALPGSEGVRLPRRRVTPGGPPLVIGGGSRRILTWPAVYAETVSVVPSLAAGHIGPEVPPRRWWRSTPTACAGRVRRRASVPTNSSCSAGPWRCRSCRTPSEMFESLAPAFGLTPEQLRAAPAALDRDGRRDRRHAARAARGARLLEHRRPRGRDGRPGSRDRRTCRHLSRRPDRDPRGDVRPAPRRPRRRGARRHRAPRSTACCSSWRTTRGRSRASGVSRRRGPLRPDPGPGRARSPAPRPAASRSTVAARATRS